jgi:predicted ester cyclase/heme-degrading monooxygenase HmoA
MFRKILIPLIIACITLTALLICLAGCSLQKAGNEKLKATYIQAVEDAYNKGEVNAYDKFLAADYIRHDSPGPDIIGLEAFKQSIMESRRVYPDLKLTVNSMIKEGNTSALRWTLQATEMSTGKQVLIMGCTLHQWANNKIVESWNYPDNLSRNQQLGYKMSPPITKNTFARVTIGQGPGNKEAAKIYEESVVPALKSQKGFRGTYYFCDYKTSKALSISIWDSEADAVANEQSGVYKAQVDKFKDFFTAKPIREGYLVTVQE